MAFRFVARQALLLARSRVPMSRMFRAVHASSRLLMPEDGWSETYDVMLTDLNHEILMNIVGPQLGVNYLSVAAKQGGWPLQGQIYFPM
jgi:hypothetical protein